MRLCAEALFALNAAIDTGLLACSARLCGQKLFWRRLIAAGCLGGVYAVAAVLPELGFLRSGLVKLCAAVGMCLLSFGAGRYLARLTAAFCAMGCVFAGAVTAFTQLTGTGLMRVPGDGYYPVSALALCAIGALCVAVCRLFFSACAQHSARSFEQLTLRLEEREISIVNYPANTEAKIESYKGGHTQMKTAKEQTPATKEVKEETGAEGQAVTMTEEQLAQLLEQAAESGATKALKAAADAADDETKDDPADDETKDDDGKDDEAKAAAPAAKEAKAAPARSAAQRKYAGIYMNTGRTDKEEKSGLPAGIGWVRFQKCMMRANKDYDIAASIARKEYGDGFLERQIKAMSVTAPTDGGYLVPEVYASEIIPLLRDKAIILRLGATELPMDRGNINIPKMTSGVSASYVGELRKAKASKAKFGNVRMSSKKLMCKVLISNDLIRSNAYGADQLILNDATTAMALAMDRAAFLGKGTEFEPTGLFNMAGIPTIDLDAAPDETTTGKMLATLLQNNADTSKLGWAFNGFAWEAFYNVVQAASGLYLYREQMDSGKLNGHEFAVSNQLPNGSGSNRPTNVVLGNFSEFMIGRQECQATGTPRQLRSAGGAGHSPACEERT